MTSPDAAPFVSQFVLQYTYKRSLGPIFSQFFTALKEGRILGALVGSGAVLVPPAEYDPATGADVSEMVEVGPEGTVTSWTVNGEQGWALIQLDGATTALLHRADPRHLRTGARVRPRWAAERSGQMSDILCFEAVDS